MAIALTPAVKYEIMRQFKGHCSLRGNSPFIGSLTA